MQYKMWNILVLQNKIFILEKKLDDSIYYAFTVFEGHTLLMISSCLCQTN